MNSVQRYYAAMQGLMAELTDEELNTVVDRYKWATDVVHVERASGMAELTDDELATMIERDKEAL